MSWKRLARMCWLLVSNGAILFVAVRLLAAFGAHSASETRVDRLLGGVFGSWSFLGVSSDFSQKLQVTDGRER
jgi:uncharacterized membrane protein